MAKILLVKEQLPARTFQGNDGQVTVVELLLTDGVDTFVATANEKDSVALVNNPLQPGTYIAAHLQFTVYKGNNGYFQNCRILKWGLYAY